MRFLARWFKRSDNTAQIAERRLLEVLQHERTLPLPPAYVDAISLKESYDGLSIIMGQGEWPELLDNLEMKLESPAMRDFFEGARVRIEAEGRALSNGQLEELSLLLSKHSMVLNPRRRELEAVGPSSPGNLPLVPPEALHSEAAFSTTPANLPAPVDWLGSQSVLHDPVLLVRHSIAAGQVIHYAGTLVILGDVSPAAEVIADRDVIVFGKLRGVVQAGALGNEGSIIAALILAPTQARIGGLIAHTPSGQWHAGTAEIVRVREGRIVVEPWAGL